jgi:hypothetical protein
LALIQAGAFDFTSLSSVVVPGNTAFVADNAFPSHCAITGARRRSRCGIQ